MQYTGHFKITKKENTQFNLFLMKRKLLSTALLVFLIIAVVVSLMNYAAKQMDVRGAVLQGLLMGVVGVVLIVAISIASMYLKLNSLYKKRQLTDFSFDALIDKDGVHSRSERGDADVPWNRIAQVVETKDAFYIVLSDQHTNVFPKPQMKDEAEIASVRSLFRKYMEPNRLKLKG